MSVNEEFSATKLSGGSIQNSIKKTFFLKRLAVEKSVIAKTPLTTKAPSVSNLLH